MRLTRAMGFVALTTGLALGCGDEAGTNPTGLTVADVVGSWNGTKWEYQDAANPTLKENIIIFGFGVNITLASSGAYAGTLTVPDPSMALCGATLCPVPFSGTVTITNGVLTLGFDNLLNLGVIVLDPADPPTFEATLDPSGNQLTLFGTGFDWDFLADDPTGDVTANLTIVLARS